MGFEFPFLVELGAVVVFWLGDFVVFPGISAVSWDVRSSWFCCWWWLWGCFLFVCLCSLFLICGDSSSPCFTFLFPVLSSFSLSN